MGFLGSESQEEKDAAADETPGCQPHWQGYWDGLAHTPQEIPAVPERLSLSLSLPRLVCVLRSLLNSARQGCPSWFILGKRHSSDS